MILITILTSSLRFARYFLDEEMAQKRYYADPKLRPPLNPDLYNLQQDELEFFQKLTGITDEIELKSHIISVQAKAYEVID